MFWPTTKKCRKPRDTVPLRGSQRKAQVKNTDQTCDTAPLRGGAQGQGENTDQTCDIVPLRGSQHKEEVKNTD